MEKYDVIVVGSGILGLSSAYHLKNKNKDLNILVVDKYSTYAQGNTSRAAAGFRDLFSSEPNFMLAHSSIEFYKHVQNELKFNLDMKFVGYLYLLENKTLKSYEKIFEKLIKNTKAEIIDKDKIMDMHPNLRLKPDELSSNIIGIDEIEYGFLGKNCGIFEPDLVSSFYFENLKSLGVEFSFNTKVEKLNLEPINKLDYPGEPFAWQDKKIGTIETNKGEFKADYYVLATDVWSSNLLYPIGIDAYVIPKKRQIFQITGESVKKILHTDYGISEDKIIPFTILPKGVYLRPSIKENSLRVSMSDDIGRSIILEDDPQPELNFYAYNIRPVLLAYIPILEDARIFSSWAGQYSISTRDDQPYIFKIMNMIYAGVTSGSGVMKGDAIGRIVESIFSDREYVDFYDSSRIKSDTFGFMNRNVPHEEFVL
jgi:glycine/D-amino acid oxidase-like deaminating enzyme